MNSFFTGRRIVVLGMIVLIFSFVLVSINKSFFQPTLFNLSNVREERSPEEIKTLEQNLTALKNSGICVKCDVGRRGSESQERTDLRQEIQAARSKGLPIDLSQANLFYVNLSGANLSGANLSGAFLFGADLTDADLTGANLSGASLAAADLQRANLTGANLHGAELAKSDLRNANLTKADLTGAMMAYTKCSGATFTGADLRGALIWTNFSGADFTNVQLDGFFKMLLIKSSFFLSALTKNWWRLPF